MIKKTKGDWMGGVAVFQDPIPKNGSYTISRVDIQFVGNFYCAPNQPNTTFLAELASTAITFDHLPVGPGTPCNCSSCFLISPTYSDNGKVQYDSYKYGGENDLLIGVITNEICLSSVFLTLSYEGAIIELLSLSPSSGPISGGTHVLVNGGYFRNTTWFCSFGSNVVGANFVNETTLECLTPESTTPGNVSVSITQDNLHWIGGGTFTYFANPDKDRPSWQVELEKFWWIWLIVVLLFGVVLISCIFLRRRMSARRNNEAMEPLLGDNSSSSNHPLIPEVLDISEIELIGTIGRGNFGEVYQGNWRGILVAVKKVKLSLEGNEEVIRDFEREADIMRFLRHPNIVQYLGLSKHREELCIVTEFMEKGSLWAILHKKMIDLDWNLKLAMAQDICKGMNYLHKCDPSVIHRDLKTHNLLVDSAWRVKVGDFGLAKLIKLSEIESSHMTACGTPAYTAPEVLRNSHYTSKADVYSFGIVLWELISQDEPHKGVPPFQVVFAVGTQGVRPTIPPFCDVGVKRIIEDCWAEDPKARPTFENLLDRFQEIPLEK